MTKADLKIALTLYHCTANIQAACTYCRSKPKIFCLLEHLIGHNLVLSDFHLVHLNHRKFKLMALRQGFASEKLILHFSSSSFFNPCQSFPSLTIPVP